MRRDPGIPIKYGIWEVTEEGVRGSGPKGGTSRIFGYGKRGRFVVDTSEDFVAGGPVRPIFCTLSRQSTPHQRF